MLGPNSCCLRIGTLSKRVVSEVVYGSNANVARKDSDTALLTAVFKKVLSCLESGTFGYQPTPDKTFRHAVSTSPGLTFCGEKDLSAAMQLAVSFRIGDLDGEEHRSIAVGKLDLVDSIAVFFSRPQALQAALRSIIQRRRDYACTLVPNSTTSGIVTSFACVSADGSKLFDVTADPRSDTFLQQTESKVVSHIRAERMILAEMRLANDGLAYRREEFPRLYGAAHAAEIWDRALRLLPGLHTVHVRFLLQDGTILSELSKDAARAKLAQLVRQESQRRGLFFIDQETPCDQSESEKSASTQYGYDLPLYNDYIEAAAAEVAESVPATCETTLSI